MWSLNIYTAKKFSFLWTHPLHPHLHWLSSPAGVVSCTILNISCVVGMSPQTHLCLKHLAGRHTSTDGTSNFLSACPSSNIGLLPWVNSSFNYFPGFNEDVNSVVSAGVDSLLTNDLQNFASDNKSSMAPVGESTSILVAVSVSNYSSCTTHSSAC